MGRKRDKRQRQQPRVNPEAVIDDVREDLRTIVRQFDRFSKPLETNEVIRYGSGTRYKIKGIDSVEDLTRELYFLAGTVYHLKDKLNQIAKGKGTKILRKAEGGTSQPVSVNDFAAEHVPLQICGDLFNAKKHGRNENQSGFAPVMQGARFMPEGVMGLYLAGDSKVMHLTTAEPSAVPYSVTVESGDGQYGFGEAIELIATAFVHYLPLIRAMNFLSVGRVEDAFILSGLKRIEDAEQEYKKKRADWMKFEDLKTEP